MKMNKLHSILIIALLPISCAPYPSPLASGARSMMVGKNQNLYKSVAIQFIENARAGNLNRLLMMTSKNTVLKSGQPEIKNIYITQIIPSFQKVKVKWDSKYKLIRDTQGNMGITFWGVASGKKSFPFFIDVYGMNGEIVIADIRTTPEYLYP